MSLKITPRMLENAASNKMVGWLWMHPLDFLRLSCPYPNIFKWIDEEREHTKPLSQYNEFAAQGKSIHMPWLDVDMHTGKVCGHEGRHRAIAVHLAGDPQMPVGVCLRDRGYPVYYNEVQSGPNHWDTKKVFVTKEDVPPVFVGQFVHREVPVNHSKMVEFWAKENR